MDEVIDYLTNIPAWFFATCEGDQRRKGQVPPLYVCRGVGRQAVVLHCYQ